MIQQFFLFIRCDVGCAFQVAKQIQSLRLRHCTEVSLVSGEWDVLVRSECDANLDFGRYLVTPIQTLPHVVRTKTEVGYLIVDPDDVFF